MEAPDPFEAGPDTGDDPFEDVDPATFAQGAEADPAALAQDPGGDTPPPTDADEPPPTEEPMTDGQAITSGQPGPTPGGEAALDAMQAPDAGQPVAEQPEAAVAAPPAPTEEAPPAPPEPEPQPAAPPAEPPQDPPPAPPTAPEPQPEAETPAPEPEQPAQQPQDATTGTDVEAPFTGGPEDDEGGKTERRPYVVFVFGKEARDGVQWNEVKRRVSGRNNDHARRLAYKMLAQEKIRLFVLPESKYQPVTIEPQPVVARQRLKIG